MNKKHQAPWECTFTKEEKGTCMPGRKPRSDQGYFEILCLCILQAGLNWKGIRKNWRKYRKGFLNFNISRLAKAGTSKLLKNSDVIRNRRKIEGIIYNAKEFQDIKKEYGSVVNFLKSLRSHPDGVELLTKRFKHLGSYSAEYFLHSLGYRK